MSDIKNMVENENYKIVLDTNVLLNPYRYSPEVSEFALLCFDAVLPHIVIPATVRVEYGKHCQAAFRKMINRVKDTQNNIKNQIERASKSVLKCCDGLDRLQFPEWSVLKEEIKDKLDEAVNCVDNFFDERSVVDFSASYWGNVDKMAELVKEIENNGSIMNKPSIEDLFSWCEEGQKRYKEELPPGFRDAKNKDGIRKYGDLIIWKEILGYSSNNKVNIIFVTDDAKSDWWESDENKNKVFHSTLMSEFKRTGQTIIAMNSVDFYSEISKAYGVQKPDIVSLALNMTDENYLSEIEDKVFDAVSDSLSYNASDYLCEDNHLGTEGIDEFEIEEYEYQDGERVAIGDSIATYHLRYKVTLGGMSFNYWGRDDDTKEVILSPAIYHTFKGTIIVEINREADLLVDIETNDYADAEIISGKFEEIYYQDMNDDWYEPEPGYLGFCPNCGEPMDESGTGFCNECSREL